MRSLHIIHSLDRRLGGVVTAALGVCQDLAEAGHETEILASHEVGDQSEELTRQYPLVKVNFVRRSFPKRFYNSEAVPAWLSENAHRFDVIELHGVFTGVTYQASKALRQHLQRSC